MNDHIKLSAERMGIGKVLCALIRSDVCDEQFSL